MTIPTREEALKALESLHIAACDGNLEHPGYVRDEATLRSYIESHTGEVVADYGDLTLEDVERAVRAFWGKPELTPGKHDMAYMAEALHASLAGRRLRRFDASPVQPDPALTEALTRIEELERALKPFADEGAQGDYWSSHAYYTDVGGNLSDFTVGDLRTAYRTLTKGIKE